MVRFLLLLAYFLVIPSFAEETLVDSRYTSWLKKKLETWQGSEATHGPLGPETMRLELLETPGERYYAGFHQWMRIHAGLPRVTEVVENIGEYEKYFGTFKQVKVLEKGENTLLTFWEQSVPVFFIPNVKFTLRYQVEKNTTRSVFRYQLTQSPSLDAVDGLIVLDKRGEETAYSEYTFSLIKRGILRSLGPGPIWSDGAKSILKSNLGMKLRSENPAWELEQVRTEAAARFEKIELDEILAKKTPVD